MGKTSMIRKFVHDIFDDKYISTLGTKVSTKRLILKHPTEDLMIEIKFMIWDIMGQRDYEMFQQSAYMGSQGALVVCDITRRETLEDIPQWVSGLFNITSQIPIIMIGNKNDLTDKKTFEYNNLTELASTFEAPSFFTSAKTGENIEKAFSTLGYNIIKIDFDQ